MYGARITGGGCGGTVVMMGRNSKKALAALHNIQNKYKAKTGIFPQLFSGSSMGANKFGSVILPFVNE
jgi:galactokinase